MKITRKILYTTIFFFGITAALSAAEHPMDTMFKTWIGTPIKQAVKTWGQPTDIDYQRGQTVYKWQESSARYIPGTMFQEKTECERKLIVDISGKIVYGTFEGNGCPFTTEGVKKWNKPEKLNNKSNVFLK